MFEKIKNGIAITHLKPGDLIVKFPLDGSIKKEIDLSNRRQFLLFEIINCKKNQLSLKMVEADRSSKSTLAKKLEDLIAEDVWWFRQD